MFERAYLEKKYLFPGKIDRKKEGVKMSISSDPYKKKEGLIFHENHLKDIHFQGK
ncbi:hypothetical protein THC_1606 [Caldimicrobium thiodismutans]|uniref:Uncharacterized protein n=1 Tax=Caldimicrobium thiodismutans TaxID=1653476 RepID=A0A0U5APV0_9BACT|nr:hypothetical protein THC_1606 [Caldimicrobium thiodismutans]